MATKVTMPQMGFDMTEGKVARWLKKVGDPVKHGEAVVEIETDKVNIESRSAGRRRAARDSGFRWHHRAGENDDCHHRRAR